MARLLNNHKTEPVTRKGTPETPSKQIGLVAGGREWLPKLDGVTLLDEGCAIPLFDHQGALR